jgi:hypothetical protein
LYCLADSISPGDGNVAEEEVEGVEADWRKPWKYGWWREWRAPSPTMVEVEVEDEADARRESFETKKGECWS